MTSLTKNTADSPELMRILATSTPQQSAVIQEAACGVLAQNGQLTTVTKQTLVFRLHASAHFAHTILLTPLHRLARKTGTLNSVNFMAQAEVIRTVLNLPEVPKGLSTFSTTDFRVKLGLHLLNWLKHDVSTYAPDLLAEIWKMPYPVLRFLGRVSREQRWALLSSIFPVRKVTLSALNWAALAHVRNQSKAIFRYLPIPLQWELLTGFSAAGLKIPYLDGFKVREFLSLCADFDLTPQSARPELLQPILNLFWLFKCLGSVKQYLRKRGFPWTITGLHDAGQFPTPAWSPLAKPPCTTKFNHWGNLCLRHPFATNYAGFFYTLAARKKWPTTLSHLRDAIAQLHYPHVPKKYHELALACARAGVSGSSFISYRKLWSFVRPRPRNIIPAISVTGESIGLPSYRFFKMDDTDVRGPILGLLTNCCQHLDGAGSSCAIAGTLSLFSGFYAITRDGELVAQTWAWRSIDGALVFDSIEAKDRTEGSIEKYAPLLMLGASAILEAESTVTRVALGVTTYGVTSALAARYRAVGTVSLVNEVSAGQYSYLDGGRQQLVLAHAPAPDPMPADWLEWDDSVFRRALAALDGDSNPFLYGIDNDELALRVCRMIPSADDVDCWRRLSQRRLAA